MAGKKGLTDLHIPTITEDAQDVVGKLLTQFGRNILTDPIKFLNRNAR